MILAEGAHILCSPQILGKYMIYCNTTEINTEKERFKAMCFILRADEICYGDLLEELWKVVYRGRDKYPTTVSDAYELLPRTSQQIGYTQRRMGQSGYRAQAGRRSEGFMFAQQGKHGGHGGHGGRGAELGNDNNQEEVAGRNEILHGGLRCYSCQIYGHYSDQCPNQTDAILTQVGVALAQRSATIKKTWVLLDMCATNSLSNNKRLVPDITECKKTRETNSFNEQRTYQFRSKVNPETFTDESTS